MPDTAHPFFKVMLVLDGAGVIVAGQSRSPVRKNDVIITPVGFRHRIEDDPDHVLALIVLCVETKAFNLAGDAHAMLGAFRIERSPAVTLEARRALRQLFFEQALNRDASAAMMTGITLQFLAILARSRRTKKPRETASPATPPELRVAGYIRELEHSFCDNEKIDNVAERLGVSRRYFTRLFRKSTGASWLTHVRALRVKHAQQLLQTSAREIAVVAFESGFEDLSSFYRAFKRETGISPQQWRLRGTE